MKKYRSKKVEKNSMEIIEKLRKQNLLNIKEGKSFTIEEARIYSKNRITQLSKANLSTKEKATQMSRQYLKLKALHLKSNCITSPF
jgi:hypothetical protein